MTDKKVADKYVRKLYKFLKGNHTFKFSKMKKIRGFVTFTNETDPAHVQLDHTDKVLSTLIHEMIHYEHQDWSEEQVLDLESKIINKLSDRQIKNLIKRFAEAL